MTTKLEPDALVALIRSRDDLAEWSEQLIAAVERRNDSLDELRAEVESLQRENGSLARAYAACEDMLRNRTGQLNQADAEVEYVKANYVTVAEEAQRRHDACAPLTVEIERLRAELARWKPANCGKIYPVPVPGETVAYCIREVDHSGAHQSKTGWVWTFAGSW